MNIWEALQKTNPVRPQPEMSKTEYKKLVDANVQLMNKIKEHQKEIERLNNIINELEKWLKYKKEALDEFELSKRKETGAFWYTTTGEIESLLDKLQELKGSDKE